MLLGRCPRAPRSDQAQLRALPRARAAAGKAALLPGSEGEAGGRVAAHNSRAMHLMYYMNDAGERVYTLKVRVRPCFATQGEWGVGSLQRGARRRAHAAPPRVHRRKLRPANPPSRRTQVPAPRTKPFTQTSRPPHPPSGSPLLAGRQVLKAPADLQKALRPPPHAEPAEGPMMRAMAGYALSRRTLGAPPAATGERPVPRRPRARFCFTRARSQRTLTSTLPGVLLRCCSAVRVHGCRIFICASF